MAKAAKGEDQFTVRAWTSDDGVTVFLGQFKDQKSASAALSALCRQNGIRAELKTITQK